MKTYYFIVVAVIVAVLAFLLFPTINTVVNSGNTTGFLPLTTAAQTSLPYAFLGMAVYAVLVMIRR